MRPATPAQHLLRIMFSAPSSGTVLRPNASGPPIIRMIPASKHLSKRLFEGRRWPDSESSKNIPEKREQRAPRCHEWGSRVDARSPESLFDKHVNAVGVIPSDLKKE